MDNCITCNELDVCEACDSSVPSYLNDTICVLDCDAGYYESEDFVCETCSDSCLTCTDLGSDNCIECATGYFMSSENICSSCENCLTCTLDDSDEIIDDYICTSCLSD